MESIRIQLGQKVRQLRKDRAWSQERLGEHARLHATYIGSIERGERNVSLDNIVKVARAFDLSPGELLSLNESASKQRRDLEASIQLLLQERRTEDLAFVRSFLKMLRRWGLQPGSRDSNS